MISDTQRGAHVRSRVRDFVLYIAIGLAFGGVLIAVVRSSVNHDVFIKWGGLAFMTAVLFGYFISKNGQFLRE